MGKICQMGARCRKKMLNLEKEMTGILTVKIFLEMRLSEIILILDQRILVVNIQKEESFFVVFPMYSLKI